MAHSEKEPNTSAPYWQANSLANRLIVISNTSVTVATAAALTELNVYKFVKTLEICHARTACTTQDDQLGMSELATKQTVPCRNTMREHKMNTPNRLSIMEEYEGF